MLVRRSGRDKLGVRRGQCSREVPPRPDPKLDEHLAQVPLDRARAEEEPCPDLGVRQAVASQPSDLPLLLGQVVARLDAALAHRLARRLQLAAGALRERLHADRGEQPVGGAELDAGVDATVLTAQRLAVEEMSAGELRTE